MKYLKVVKEVASLKYLKETFYDEGLLFIIQDLKSVADTLFTLLFRVLVIVTFPLSSFIIMLLINKHNRKYAEVKGKAIYEYTKNSNISVRQEDENNNA